MISSLTNGILSCNLECEEIAKLESTEKRKTFGLSRQNTSVDIDERDHSSKRQSVSSDGTLSLNSHSKDFRTRRLSSRSYSEDLNKTLSFSHRDKSYINIGIKQSLSDEKELSTIDTSNLRRGDSSNLFTFPNDSSSYKLSLIREDGSKLYKHNSSEVDSSSQLHAKLRPHSNATELNFSTLPPIISPQSQPNRKTSFLPGIRDRNFSANSSHSSLPQRDYKSTPNLAENSMNRKSFGKRSVLVDSVKLGRVRHVQLLLSAGMDPNKKDETGMWPKPYLQIVMIYY